MTLVPQPVIWPGFGMLIPACFFCCCSVFCLFVLVLFVPGLDYYRKALIILVDGEPANLQTRERPMTREASFARAWWYSSFTFHGLWNYVSLSTCNLDQRRSKLKKVHFQMCLKIVKKVFKAVLDRKRPFLHYQNIIMVSDKNVTFLYLFFLAK